MRKKYLFTIFLFSLNSFLFAQESIYNFVENKGQWNKKHHYRADIPGGFLFLNSTSLSYAFYDTEAVHEKHHGDHEDHVSNNIASEPAASSTKDGSSANRPSLLLSTLPTRKLAPIPKDRIRAHAFHVNFLNALGSETFKPSQKQRIKKNYFLGKDRSKWVSDASSFAEVTYQRLYEGIDLRFFQNEFDLKYEFIVAPEADPSEIKMSYDGVVQIKLFNEHLYIQTSLNTIIEQKPFSYQLIDGKQVEIPSKFVVEGTHVSFEFPEGYDPNYELVIDPVLIFSTFSGSVSDNWGNTATFDTLGNLYNGGIVFGIDFPLSTGAYDVSFNGELDVVIQQFDNTGSFVNYATYIGGTEAEIPYSLIVNEFNELVILGSTSSSNYPTSTNAYDSIFNFGSSRSQIIGGIDYNNGSDLFISVLNPAGSQLLGSTYIGGRENDGINDASRSRITRNYGDEFRGDVITDKEGNIYFVSNSQSSDFPTTSGVIQEELRAPQNAVIGKLNRDVSQLEWATFLGGEVGDAAYSVKLKKNGQVVVAGGTASFGFPTTENAFRINKETNESDGFVSILSPNADSLVFSTFVGTDSYDQVFFIDLDGDENVSLFGQTQGSYPVTEGVYSNPNSGQFIHKLNATLDSTIFSTVIGSSSGSPNICPTAFLVSECSNIYIAGWGGNVNDPLREPNYIGGNTLNMPTTENAFQSDTDGSDFYFMVLSPDASELLYGTYLGGMRGEGSGEHVDGGTCRFDKKGIVYHSVCSCGNTGFPSTPNAYATENLSRDADGDIRCNNAAFKFDLAVVEAAFEISETSVCAELPITFFNKSIGGKDFTWRINGEIVSNTSTSFNYIFDEAGSYVVNLTVEDPATCVKINISDSVLVVNPQNFSVGEDQEICRGESVELSAGGGVSYSWLPTTNISDPTSPNPIVTPEETTVYLVKIINEFGCEVDSIVRVTVNPKVEADFQATIIETCDTLQQVRIDNLTIGAENWTWQLGDGRTISEENPGIIQYDQAGTYQIILNADNPTCSDADTLTVEVNDIPSSFFFQNITITPEQNICDGESVQLEVTAGEAYFWSPNPGLSNPSVPNPIASPSSTTEYAVRVFNERGCFYDTSVVINVVPQIDVNFNYSRSGRCGERPEVALENLTDFAEKYTWQMGNGEIIESSEPELNYSYPDTGVYTITLVAETGGCTYSAQQEILIESVIPPNAFSPNGDGLNDTFEIPSQEQGWRLQIFTRWGDLIYTSENYQNDFAGQDLTESTYLYLLTSPIGTECKGWFKVLR